MRFQFEKMQGCGNDFLFYDQMKEDEVSPFRKSEIQFLCDRNFGVGADGLVILCRGGTVAHCKWRFFNRDGSEAQMCGNAARCAIRYLSDHYFPDEEVISIETQGGVIKGKVLEGSDLVEVTLFARGGHPGAGSGDAKAEIEEKIIRTKSAAHSEDEVIRCYCIDTGVPHAVIEVSDIRHYPIARVGNLVMHHPAFQPELTNVTFFQQQIGPQILACTYERGVEHETLGCGTGAAAAAMVFSQLYLQPLPVSVTMPGGAIEVDASLVAKRVLLRGSAVHVARVSLEEIPQDFQSRQPFEGSGA